MEDAGAIVANIARLAVYIFGAMSVLAVCYAGFLYMTAAGDPQKSGQARNALFGAIGGMIIVGIAFIVPRLISETVIEPGGGTALGGSVAISCDQVFKNQLVRQQAAGNASRMNQLIVQVQARQDECAEEVWDPIVLGTVPRGGGSGWPALEDITSATLNRCATRGTTGSHNVSDRTVAGLDVPDGLHTAVANDANAVTRRDGQNNIIVFFDRSGGASGLDALPSDGAHCWMYVDRLGTWVSGYQE